MRTSHLSVLLVFLLGPAPALAADRPAPDEDKPIEIRVRTALALPLVVQGGRVAFARDPVAVDLASGQWNAPEEGDVVQVPGLGERTWRKIEAGEDGWFRGRELIAGYVFARLDVREGGVYVLQAQGHSAVYVNGVPRGGNPYGYSYWQLPVALRKGENELLFRVGRGQLRASVRLPRGAVEILESDFTVPDLVRGQKEPVWLGVPVVNCRAEVMRGLVLTVMRSGEEVVGRAELAPLLPCGIYKAPVQVELPNPQEDEVDLRVSVRSSEGEILTTCHVTLRVVSGPEARKVTFVSAIDDSVQYLALVPPTGRGPHGLVLTLHGASVEAIGQARAYRPKPDLWIVAPTNRRPFGFDWEDWGRLDAMEVLDLVTQRLEIDPRRVYLTGHSMGGHGTWHLGVTFPDRFAAIGPSAGWISFAHYGGGRRRGGKVTPAEDALDRAAAPSRTLDLVPNLLSTGVYVLHGTADDNVPVGQARLMRQVLGQFHPDFVYHEEPGKGHWWNADPSRFAALGGAWGTACVDWPPMFQFFRWHVKDDAPRRVLFRTFNPSISSRCHWVTAQQQLRPLELSSVVAEMSSDSRKLVVQTENVRRFSLDLGRLPRPDGLDLQLVVDGTAFELRTLKGASFVREGGTWRQVVGALPTGEKGPHRYGPFREAFQNHVVFVYGTGGTREEVQWCLNKARRDAEVFWYRGNGAAKVMSDSEFLGALSQGRRGYEDNNVVLYGGKDCNRAYDVLVREAPIEVSRGRVRLGKRVWGGGDFGVLFVYPRAGTDRALVAVQAGTGERGREVLDQVTLFVSGVGIPDYVIARPEVFRSRAEGIVAAGFFDQRWKLPEDTGIAEE